MNFIAVNGSVRTQMCKPDFSSVLCAVRGRKVSLVPKGENEYDRPESAGRGGTWVEMW